MKQSQVAVEFLMTYGWAMLGVLMVVAAIVYFGVIDASSFVPERCDLGYRLGCKDYLLSRSDNSLSLNIVNNFNNDIMITRIDLNSTKFSPACISTYGGSSNGENILIGQVKSFRVDCVVGSQLASIKDNKKNNYDVTIWYYLNGTTSAYTYPLYGELYARISS